MRIAESIGLFLEAKEAENLAHSSIGRYEEILKHFCRWLDDDALEIHQLTASHLNAYLAHERRRGLAAATRGGIYTGLQAWLNWCEYSDEVGNPPNPMGHGRRKAVKAPKVPDKIVRHIKPHEYERLLASIDLASWIDYRDWCIIQLLYWTGIRRAELCALTIDDIDFVQGVISIEHGKGDKQRTIPIEVLDDVISGLKAYMEMRPPWKGREMWVAWDAYRKDIKNILTHSGLRQMLKRRCGRAGIRYTNAHLYRHTFATNLLNAGAGLDAVSELLGHADTRVTKKVYAKYAIAGLRRAYNSAVHVMRSGQE